MTVSLWTAKNVRSWHLPFWGGDTLRNSRNSQKGRCQDVTFSTVHNKTITPISVRTQMCLFFSKRKYNFCFLFKCLPLSQLIQSIFSENKTKIVFLLINTLYAFFH